MSPANPYATPLGEYMTSERREIQAMARDFAMSEVLPAANELDPVDGLIPERITRMMGELGFFGILIPEEHGGLGLGAFEYCLVAEELARAWMSVASLMARGNGLTKGFTDEQRDQLLPRMARGEYLGAVALSEPDAGSDVASLTCRARKTDGGWLIKGQKMWCTFADGADFIVVFARSEPVNDSTRRHQGISAFLVDKERGSFPDGLSGQSVRKIGYRGWKTWELSFEDLFVPSNALLGEEGRGFYAAMDFLNVARAHTAARGIGLARAALEDSMLYAKQRAQFGHPISDFQAIRFKIATMATEIEAARQLNYAVCAELDSGRPAGTQAAMSKYFATEMAVRATGEGMQIHGGAGYTTDFAMERHWRDARLTTIFEGTSEIQQRIISTSLLGREGNS